MPGRVLCLQSLLALIATIHSVTTGRQSHSWGTNHNCWALGTSARVNRKGNQGGLSRAVAAEVFCLSSHQLNWEIPPGLLSLSWSHSQGINPSQSQARKLILIIPHYFPARPHSSPVTETSLEGILLTWIWTPPPPPCIISNIDLHIGLCILYVMYDVLFASVMWASRWCWSNELILIIFWAQREREIDLSHIYLDQPGGAGGAGAGEERRDPQITGGSLQMCY